LKNSETLTIPITASAATTALVYRADSQRQEAALILAHGAGAGQRSSFIVAFAEALSAAGLDVVTFNFLYIEQKRRVPDRGPALEACYRAVIGGVRSQLESARMFLAIGGKSMGGRIATQVAAGDSGLPVDGLVLLGYPLHQPGKPAVRRDAHLPAVKRPMLFVQGSRDAFGTPAEFTDLLTKLSPPAMFHTVAGGDHSFNLTTKDPGRQAAAYGDVQQMIVKWIRTVSANRRQPPTDVA
jgi:predicted alpha/beta-hydrolase family hydrolase